MVAPLEDGPTRQERAMALEAEVAEVCGILNATSGRLVELIASVIEAGSWAGVGVRSPEHWVAWQCGLSPSRARHLVRLAARSGELPDTLASLCHGSLSEDQAAVMARFVPAGFEADVAELAPAMTVSQLRRTLSAYPFPKEEPPEDAEPTPSPPPEEKRRVSFSTTDEGTWRISGGLPLDEGALVERALRTAREWLFSKVGADSDDEAKAARCGVSWADALVSLAEGALATRQVENPSGSRHLVWVHLNADDVQADHPDTDGPASRTASPHAHLHLGPSLPDALRRLITCDARVRPVWHRGGHPINVGRSTRSVNDAQRMAVEERDRGCRIPGCERTRWLQIHHVIHWEDGGRSDLSNLVALCSAHHRLHHRGGLGITGNAEQANGLVITDARGRELAGSGRPAPPEDPPDQAAKALGIEGHWEHPIGEPLQTKWLDFSRR